MRGLIFLAISLVTTDTATNITYSVISLTNGTHTMGVIVNEQVYPLSVSKKSSLLHTGDAPIADKGYSYTMLENDMIVNPENFTRESVEKDTVNEHYNRTWNKWKLDKLPIVLPSLPIINRIDTDLHIDGEIATIHLRGNETELDIMHKNSNNETLFVPVNMTYISLEKVKSFENVKLQISGHSTRTLPKLSYKVNIPKKEDLFGYRRFKFRSLGTDGSYMRDYLVYDMYNSVGLPTSKYSYIRVYMNDEPIGLFGLAENLRNPWIRNEFANGDKKFKQGGLFVADVSGNKQMGGNGGPRGPPPEGNMGEAPSPEVQGRNEGNGRPLEGPGGFGGPGSKSGGADLSYLGNNVSLYSEGHYSLKEEPSKRKANFTRIMELTKFISEASNTTTDDSTVPLWEEKIDVDSFLRGMVMEILTSNSDGYFTMVNNYLLYDDIENERLIFSGSDFDLTMGHGMYNMTALTSGNYSEYPGFDVRPLTKMLNIPKFKNEFENLIVNITQDLINPDILSPCIDQLAEMLTSDVEWDKNCVRKGSGNGPFGFGGHNTTQPGQDQNDTQPGDDYDDSQLEEGYDSAQPEQNENDQNNNSIMAPNNPGKGGGPNFGDDVPFIEAVNGTSNSSNSLAVKEWVELKHRNIMNFYNKNE